MTISSPVSISSLHVDGHFQLATYHPAPITDSKCKTIDFRRRAVVNVIFTFRRTAPVHLVNSKRDRNTLVLDVEHSIDVERIAIFSPLDSRALEMDVGKFLGVEKIR